MGKIYDALEKSKEKHNASVAFDETHDAAVSAKVDRKDYAKKPVSLYKDIKVTDASSKRINSVEDLKQGIKVASFSKTEVLYDDNHIDKNMVTLLKPQSFEAEQFKILRTNLLFPSSGRSPRTIMVVSSMPDEGKSLISANLHKHRSGHSRVRFTH